MWRFSASYDKGGKPCWWLYASNGEMVAWAGESFYSLSNATRAAQEFKVGAATARFEVYLDAGGRWRWRALRSSDKVAASGQHFASKYDAERAAKNVQANAGGATGP
ncbi:hypothetical protein A5675_17330 [Mycobacterium malmoense]|uniref:YegP family protein n=1 Tax=Mycobacterium malmoense TaxID=1780 RepID=UPI00080B0D1F|nr:DUF1508 domain-containing protein [Mycobacterium malmoense]OCB36990.1 hypothetical protein A5675_17330 [Mycobacterium malmoense]